MIRLYLPIDQKDSPRVIVIGGERFHYLAHVLRLGEGQTLELFDGHGRSFPAQVAAVSQGEATLTLDGPRAEPKARSILLVQGLPKSDRFEWTLQKATELGAAAFHPVHSERSVVKVPAGKEPERRKRWQRIVEEAARQCGRSDVPSVEPVGSLVQVCERLVPSTGLLVLDEEERSLPLGIAAHALPPTKPVAIIVGPEGGLARSEVEALKRLGGVGVTLGRLILRSETAGIAALCVLRHQEGLLG
jgi:16S rRNA (uracil1498-N3)-methyltransferase